VIIAPSADVFFWEAGEIGCSYSLDRAVFWLFGDTNSDIAASGTVRVNCIDEADPLLCSRGNSPSELQALQTFGTPNAAAFLIELLKRFFLGKCRR
jgi:hypothetical protein